MKNLVAILLTSQSLVTASESNETMKADFKDQPDFIQMRNQMNEENEILKIDDFLAELDTTTTEENGIYPIS